MLRKNIMDGPHKKGMNQSQQLNHELGIWLGTRLYIQVHICPGRVQTLGCFCVCSCQGEEELEAVLCLSQGIPTLLWTGTIVISQITHTSICTQYLV